MLKPVKISLLISGLLLCLALIPFWPYGYYVVLRWVVCATCGYAAYVFMQNELPTKHVVSLVFLAFLFNPIAVLPFDLSLWLLVYLGSAVCLLTLAKKIPL